MLLLLLLLIPLIAMLINFVRASFVGYNLNDEKSIAFTFSILNLLLSLVVWILLIPVRININSLRSRINEENIQFICGADGLSIYFVLLTTIIIPIALISNWKYYDIIFKLI